MKDEYPTAEALIKSPELAQQALEAYIQHRSGPFAAPTSASGFASLEKVDPELFKNAESHLQSLVTDYARKHANIDLAGRDSLLDRQLLDPKEAVTQIIAFPSGANIENSHVASKLYPCSEDGMWCVMGACSTRSLSRGSVHIKTSDPTEHPVIDPAYFKHPLDVDLMARSLLHILTFIEIEPLKSVLRRNEDGTPVLSKPQAETGLPETLDEAKEWVVDNSITLYHPVGTCAMLPKEKGGVVDNQCRVYDVSNVRVADASIFPLHVQGNIVSLVYALAEKAADLIQSNIV